jgi:hypothetical protein
VCRAPVTLPRRKYCSADCTAVAIQAPAAVAVATAKARQVCATSGQSRWVDLGLISFSEADGWAREASAIPWSVRTPKAHVAAIKARLTCRRCGSRIATVGRLQRRPIFCSRLCYLAHRTEDLRLDPSGDALARYYPPADSRLPPEPLDPARTCRGFIDEGEPCPSSRTIRRTSPLGMCPVCAASTFSGRLDDKEQGGADPLSLVPARRAVAALALLAPPPPPPAR